MLNDVRATMKWKPLFMSYDMTQCHDITIKYVRYTTKGGGGVGAKLNLRSLEGCMCVCVCVCGEVGDVQSWCTGNLTSPGGGEGRGFECLLKL